MHASFFSKKPSKVQIYPPLSPLQMNQRLAQEHQMILQLTAKVSVTR